MCPNKMPRFSKTGSLTVEMDKMRILFFKIIEKIFQNKIKNYINKHYQEIKGGWKLCLKEDVIFVEKITGM